MLIASLMMNAILEQENRELPLNQIEEGEEIIRLKRERDELDAAHLAALSNVSKALAIAIKERDELAAHNKILRKFARHRNDSEVCCDLLRSSEFGCSCGYEEALSITPSDALREIQARTLEECASELNGSPVPECKRYAADFREMAAAKRKGD